MVDKIRIGKRRRLDLGDIAGLAESIEDLGLLHSITVDQDGRPLAGARRLAVYKRLGRTDGAAAPDQQRLVEGLKTTADTKRHHARRNRKPAPEGER
jgi:hypothetical protein